MNNTPDYDEDAPQCNDGMLLTDEDKSPFLSEQDWESCNSLSEFFANAWNH